MGDRTDIDALLIGALYGELSAADRARLTAHLESHPADRTALADLTRTREAVRHSRILAIQHEPPQSVTALLIQEAARRIPNKTEREAGWFQRLTRALLLHPAIAAAAMLVLVVSVAGTLHMMRGDQFAETGAAGAMDEPVPASTLAATPMPAETVPAGAGSAAPVAPMAPSATPPAPTSPDMTADPGARAAAAADGQVYPPVAAASPGAYRVGLDQERRKVTQTTERDQSPALELAQGFVARERGAEAKDSNAKPEVASESQAAKKQIADPAPSKPQPQQPQKGIVLQRPEPMPKELADRALSKADLDADARTAPKNKAAPGPGVGGATGSTGDLDRSGFAAAPAQAVPAGPSANNAQNLATSKTPSKLDANAAQNAAPPPASQPAPAAPPPAPQRAEAGGKVGRDGKLSNFTNNVDDKFAEDKPADDKTQLAWARKQRDKVIAAVQGSDCQTAASLATEIYNRAPGYYASSIANHRDVKACVAYLNRDREREDRSRALKRGVTNEAPAQQDRIPSKRSTTNDASSTDRAPVKK
jgi:anti-sigma factor RsiW